jgi:hypothetical protein
MVNSICGKFMTVFYLTQTLYDLYAVPRVGSHKVAARNISRNIEEK